MARDIARNRRVSTATVYREAVEQYLSGYGKVQSLKEAWRKIESSEAKIRDLERQNRELEARIRGLERQSR